MNRNLLLFAIFIIVLGAGFNFYLLSLLGLLVLIPALLIPSRPLPRPASEPPKQEAWRISPPKPKTTTPPAELAPTSMAKPSAPTPTQPSLQPSYSPALFPTSMFPSLSLLGTVPPQAAAPAAKPSERDELVEAGALLALLRLFLG